ncbi:hypothetical protein IW136_004156 [Coemansia sp. RSA 678]|nr:hypothetical protein IW136_004156 [Coemansia sp. RSA 678]
MHKTIRVPAHATGLRVDRFISNETHMAPSLLFKLLRKRSVAHIDADGKRHRLHGSTRVHTGMEIQIPTNIVLPQSTPISTRGSVTSAPQFVQRQLPVLFDNQALSVFQKPSGLSCQGGSKVTYSVDSLLNSNSTEQFRLVHRLDRGTTGALVVAKTRLAAARLAAAFRDHEISKTYIAVLRGVPDMPHGTINCPLLNTGPTVISLINNNLHKEKYAAKAKSAITKYRVLKSGSLDNTRICVVALNILTGRKHQIRAHCAHVLKCPVLNDSKYGSESTTGSIHLHLSEITIPVSSI